MSDSTPTSIERTTPLASVHEAAGAALVSWEGCRVPGSYGDPAIGVAAATSGVALFDLAHVGLALISGEDCRRFSNGMFTNNLRKLQPGHGNRNALADLKGRLLAITDLYCVTTDPDRFYVTVEGRDFTWFFERLDRYIIMDDVEVEDLGVGHSLLSLQGPGAAAALAAVGLPVPVAQHAEADGIDILVRDRCGGGGYDLIVPADVLGDTWAALLAAGATAAGIDALEAGRIAAGKVRYPTDLTAKTFAHELGMRDELLAFDKGCYLGQEVINRMDTMGRVNKRLAGLVAPGGAALDGAEAVLNDKVVGTVTSAAVVGGRSLGLAILRNAAIEAGRVTLRTPAGEVEAVVSCPPFADERG